MKHSVEALFLSMIVTLTACYGSQVPGPVETTAVPITPSPASTPTVTQVPTLTPTEIPTITPSPTPYLSPTATPVDFVLADRGYDIANVRYSYPRPDMLVVDFEYRLDENIKSDWTQIWVEIPRRCEDNSIIMFDFPQPGASLEERAFGTYFFAPAPAEGEQPVGEGRVSFKMTMEGTCSAEGLEFLIYPLERANTPDVSYKEYVLQPFEVTRDFPTLNSDQLSVKNFYYQPAGRWSGLITFDYQISEAIPIPPEEYHFLLRSSGKNGTCEFSIDGPAITAHSGTYEFPVDLLSIGLDQAPGCLNPALGQKYPFNSLFLFDDLAYAQVYRQELDFSYIVRP